LDEIKVPVQIGIASLASFSSETQIETAQGDSVFGSPTVSPYVTAFAGADKDRAKNAIAVKIIEAIEYLINLANIFLPFALSVSVRRGGFDKSSMKSLN
jgi:hypothetical protein